VNMPFGKHRGQPLEEVPTSYLQWLLDNCDLRPQLQEAVEEELGQRWSQPPPEPVYAIAELSPWEEVVRTWHREMALRFHPDRGGSAEVMKALNHAADRLKELFREQTEEANA